MITKYVANQVDMIGLLNVLNEPVIKKGKKYKWTKHNSIEFYRNMWYQHSFPRGGLPIKFLKIFFGMNDATALNFIIEHYDTLKKHDTKVIPKKLKIPNKAYSNDKAFFYLSHFRNIDKNIIKTFMNNQLIYQEEDTDNILFIGKDKTGGIKHIHKRNTHDSNFRVLYNQSGSQAEYSFNFIGKSSKLYVFESPIDMMSYISLNKDNWGTHSYVALCGVNDASILRILNDYQYLKDIILCLDNDLPGLEASHTIKEKLVQKRFKVTISPSTFKDYNEDLKFSKGLPAESGFNEPAMKLYDDLLDNILDETFKLRSISIKEVLKSYSKVLYSYKENEPVSKYTFNALKETATLSSKFIHQQFTHLEQNLTHDTLKERLYEKNNYHIYINISNNMRNMTYQITEIRKNFNEKTFHTKEDKLKIINLLMSFTNALVYTHVYLTLSDRKK